MLDQILPALVTAAPQTALLAYLVVLLRQVQGHASTDRGDYRADLDAAEARHAAETKRLQEAYAADITRLRESYAADMAALRETSAADVAAVRAELHDMRQRLAAVYAELDQERRARWKAEDAAAELKREQQLVRAADGLDTIDTTGR